MLSVTVTLRQSDIWGPRSHHNSVDLLCWIFHCYQLGTISPGLDWLGPVMRTHGGKRIYWLLECLQIRKTLDCTEWFPPLWLSTDCWSLLFSLRPGGDAGWVSWETIVNNCCDGEREREREPRSCAGAAEGQHLTSHHTSSTTHHSVCRRPEAAATPGRGEGGGVYQLLGCIMVQCGQEYHQCSTSLSVLW